MPTPPQTAFTDPQYPLGGFQHIHNAVEQTAKLLDVARRCNGPVASCYTGYSSKAVDRMIKASQQHQNRADAGGDFRDLQAAVAEDVPVLPLWQAKEYVVTSEDIGGGQYLSDGTGVFRLWRLTRL